MGLGSRSLLASAALTIAACGNSFSSADGADAGSGADVTTTDAGGTDAGSNDSSSGGGDTGPADTGPADAGKSDGGPVSSYCATHLGTYDFCEDFDSFTSVTPFLSSWTTFSQTGGTFAFDTTNVPSPPNALRATTTSSSNVRLLVIKLMPPATGPIARQRLEFDFLVNGATSTQFLSVAAVAAIVFGSDVSGGVVALGFGNGTGMNDTLEGLFLGPTPTDGGVPAYNSSNAPPPVPSPGVWDGRFAVEIDYPGPDAGSTGGTPACAQIYIGVTPQLTPCLALPPSLSHPPSVTSIALGVYSGGVENTGSIDVGFDNVTFVGQ
jgi:hypothetical protein